MSLSLAVILSVTLCDPRYLNSQRSGGLMNLPPPPPPSHTKQINNAHYYAFKIKPMRDHIRGGIEGVKWLTPGLYRVKAIIQHLLHRQ